MIVVRQIKMKKCMTSKKKVIKEWYILQIINCAYFPVELASVNTMHIYSIDYLWKYMLQIKRKKKETKIQM